MMLKTTTNEQEVEICRLYLSGLSKKNTGKQMSIGEMVVTRVLKDRNVKIRSSGGVRPYNVNGNAFDDLTNPTAAYWLGFIFADGGISRSNMYIALSAKDRSQLESFANFLGVDKPIKSRTIKDKYRIVEFGFSDRPLMDKLRSMGMEPHRPNSLKMLRLIPDETMNHFLRGWFDGDGCAYTKPQLCFIANTDFLDAVQDIFIKECGTKRVTLKACHKTENRHWGNLIYRGRFRCSAIADYLYNDAENFLERKLKRILEWHCHVDDRPVSRRYRQ